MNTFIFLTLFTLLGALYFFLGLRASKNVKTARDYFVANKQLGVWQITCNLIATQLGGGMLLGTAAAAYATGLYGMFYNVGMALGFLLLGCGIAARLQQFNITTTAELFELRYKSSNLKMIASLLSIATLFGILIAQVVGFKSLMATIGFSAWYIVLPFWLSVVVYTMVGGLRAITINDMVQLALICCTFVGIFVYCIMQPGMGIGILIEQQNIFTAQSLATVSVVGTILMPALFSLIEQDLAQRFFASKTQAVATQSAFNAALFTVLFSIIPVYMGIQTKLLGISFPDGANPLLVFLQTIVPTAIFALALCAIIAAIVSTADALMNGISANITQDFKLAEKLGYNTLTVSKVTTFGIGLCALVASYCVNQSVIDILIQSYELSVVCLLVPLLFCYFKKDISYKAAYAAIIFGFIGFIMGRLYITPFPREIIALALSYIAYICVEKIIMRN